MKKTLIALFLLIPIVLVSVIFISPDKAISNNENRTLKTKNSISLDTFQDDVEGYLADQIPFRDNIVALRSNALYLIGKRDINGAYVGNGRLFQKITESGIDKPALQRYADKVNTLAENVEAYVMLIPSAGIVLKDELPKNAMMYDYDSLYNELSQKMPNAKIIKPTQLDYYKTDHHWTADGSYSAYLEWCKAHSISPKSFEFDTVTEEFRGTLYSKALLKNIPADTIKSPIIYEEIIVTADGQPIELYDRTKADYDYFQGGNHGIVTIENKNVHNGKRLLILKDSFANSFAPYLVADYEKIILLDERYTFTTPQELIEQESITELAVIKEIID